jgi:hypothetical protein
MLLTVSLEASLETIEAATWYEKKAAYLGNRFLDDLQDAYNKIQSRPESFGYFNNQSGVRKGRLDHFPYNVYYIIETTEIRVIAIIHSSRSSRFVKRRIQ